MRKRRKGSVGQENPLIADRECNEKLDQLDELAMGYEVCVIPLFEEDYLKEFCDRYEIKDRSWKPVPFEEGFDEAIKTLRGEYRWEEIAALARRLFGLPARILFPDDVSNLKEELGGRRGLSPFFFVFDLMFCEYEGFTLCYLFGTNN